MTMLYGAKMILRYLSTAHQIDMCRDTLHSLRKKRGQQRIPVGHVQICDRLQLVAKSADLDSWAEERLASAKGASLPQGRPPTLSDAVE